MDIDDSLSLINAMGFGDHLCYLYDSPYEHRTLMTEFLRLGLERNERVMYLTDSPHDEATVLAYLVDAGIEPRPYLWSGQLVIAESRVTYLPDGTFSSDRMINGLKEGVDEALAMGYTGLRATGEMSWALNGHCDPDGLCEYEQTLDESFEGLNLVGICQYDRRRFDIQTLQRMGEIHSAPTFGGKDGEVFEGPLSIITMSNGIRLMGEADLTTSECLSRALAVALRGGGDAYIDISDLVFADVSGFTPIVEAAEALSRKNTNIVLVAPSATVSKLIKVFDWDHLEHLKLDSAA